MSNCYKSCYYFICYDKIVNDNCLKLLKIFKKYINGVCMKRYIAMLAFVLFVNCGSYTGSVFGVSVRIVPTTEGEDSIVDAIKQYSNVTEADVKQYKLLKLGSVGTIGAFVLGAASTLGAGVGMYKSV